MHCVWVNEHIFTSVYLSVNKCITFFVAHSIQSVTVNVSLNVLKSVKMETKKDDSKLNISLDLSGDFPSLKYDSVSENAVNKKYQDYIISEGHCPTHRETSVQTNEK